MKCVSKSTGLKVAAFYWPGFILGTLQTNMVRQYDTNYLAGDMLCAKCNDPMKCHGLVSLPQFKETDQGAEGLVCPRTYILTMEDGAVFTMERDKFNAEFNEIVDVAELMQNELNNATVIVSKNITS